MKLWGVTCGEFIHHNNQQSAVFYGFTVLQRVLEVSGIYDRMYVVSEIWLATNYCSDIHGGVNKAVQMMYALRFEYVVRILVAD